MIQPTENQILIKQILINQLNQILILEPVSVDLKKLTFDKKVAKNDLSKINKVNGEIPSITNLDANSA